MRLVSFCQTSLLVLICTISFAQSNSSLKVAVYDSPPFGLQYEDGTYGGLMVELWEEIASEIDIQYEYELTDMDELMLGLNDETYQVGLGAISITPSREILVDFSHAVNPSGTGIAVKSGTIKSNFFAYAKPIVFSLLRLVISLLLLLVISGTLVWYFERRKNDAVFHRKIKGLGDGLWWAAVTMTTVGYGDKVPKTRIGRSIAIAWMFIGIIMVSLFTADASSIFTTIKLDSHVQTVDDLRNIRVGAAEKSSGQEFLIREHVKHIPYDDLEQAIDAMLNHEIDAIVSNVPVLLYLNKHKYHNQLLVSSKLLLKNNMGIALSEDSELREQINQILLKKISEPQWQQSLYKYLGETN